MEQVKRIVCLANSLKNGGSCIAGREVHEDGTYGGWIRPVSARPTSEVSMVESWCEESGSPNLLDVIDVPLKGAVPRNHQTENYEIDAARQWVKRGRLPWEELAKLREYPTSLWTNSDRTSRGAFDCISQGEAAAFATSLMLIKSDNFAIETCSKRWEHETRKAYRGSFKYGGTYYNLHLTDSVAMKACDARGDGAYRLKDVYLCISLTGPWARDNNRCHKLVASVIGNPPL